MPNWCDSALKMGFSFSYLMMCCSKFSSSSSNLYFSSSFTKLVIVSSFWLMFSSIILDEDRFDWLTWLTEELWFRFLCWLLFLGGLPRAGCTKGLRLYNINFTEVFDGCWAGYSFGTDDLPAFCHFYKAFIRIFHIFAFDFVRNGDGNPWTLSTEWSVLAIWTGNDNYNVLAHDSHN